MNRTRIHRSIAAIAALTLAVFALSSCEDFFGTTDLKESIREEVVVATAEAVPVTVRPDPDVPGGTTSVAAGTQKVGVPFEVSVTVFSQYAFDRWTEPSGTGAVTFASPTSQSTTATITEPADGIIIQADFVRRPELESTDPFNYAENVYKNKTIRLYFSKPMDPSTVTSDTISITHRPFQTEDPPESIGSRFEEPVPSPANLVFTLELATGQELSETHVVTLRVSKVATDAAGHEMAEDAILTFLVSNEVDLALPVWDDTDAFTIRRPDGSLPGAGNAINTTDLILRPRAFDNDLVLYLNLTEDDGSTSVDSRPLYQSAIDYTLQTAGQGTKTLRVTAEDPSGNVTADTQQLTLIYDTESPGLPTVTAAPPSPANAPVTFTVNATDVGLADIDEYRLTGGATTTPTSSSGTFTSVTPAAEGANTISVVAVDNASNTSTAQNISVFYDTVAPAQPTITVPATTPTAVPISLSVTSSDPSPASGIIEYRIIAGTDIVPLNSATGTFTNVTPATQGDNTLRIVAIDDAGNISTERTTTVFYDSEAPVVSGFAVGQDASTDTTTTSRTVRVWANPSDISPPVEASFATSTSGPWSSYESFTSGSTTYVLPSTPDTYTVYARFRDALENETTAAITDTIDFDNLPPDEPTVTIAPASPTNIAVSFSVSAGDNGPSGIDYYAVTGGATTTPTSTNGDFTGVTPAAQGPNNITVVAVDRAGNSSLLPLTIPVVYDTQSPDAPSISGAPIGTISGQFGFTADALDNGDAGIDFYEITGGATGTLTSSDGVFSGLTPASQGSNTVAVRAIDNATNTSPAATFTVDYDSEPPVVTNYGIGVTTRTDSYTTSATVKVWANVSESNGPVEISMSTSSVFTPGPGDWETFTSGTTEFTLPTEGDVFLYAYFRDAVANETTTAVSDSIIYDASGPNAPVVTVAPQSPTNSSVSFTVEATDVGDAGVASYEIVGGATGSTMTSTDGAFSGLTPNSEGDNNILVVATDNAGNTGSNGTVFVVYDTQPPSVSGFSVGQTTADEATTTSTTIIAWATVTEANGPVDVRFSTDNATWDTYREFTSGTTTYVLPGSAGTYTAYAQFRDAASNETTDTISDDIEYQP